MKNVTISIDESLLKQTREFARRQNQSVNALIRDLLKQTVARNNFPNDFLTLAEETSGSSKGKKWTRDSLYERN